MRRWYGGAARFEDAVEGTLGRWLARRGWRPRLVLCPAYGAAADAGGTGWIRVLGRVLVLPPDRAGGTRDVAGRGWRRFMTIAAPGVPVVVQVGDRRHRTVAGAGGYVDVRMPSDLAAGVHQVRAVVDDGITEATGPGRTATAPAHIVAADATRGVVSDIDDTVVITALPRPLLAFWNTFVRRGTSRHPVPGMAEFLHAVADAGFVAYLSTGAWNYAPVLRRFLAEHDYPAGPLLMTDWGPSPERWFRSGQAHKHSQLARLHAEYPQVRWVLVGDNGQHDPAIYDDFSAAHPDAVGMIAIRTLSPAQQVFTHGTPGPPETLRSVGDPTAPDGGIRRLRGPDGYALLNRLEDDQPGKSQMELG